MTRLLFYTDPHIGSGKQYGREHGDRLLDQETILERAVALAIEHSVDVMVGGGDLFHGPKVETEEYAAAQRPFRRLSDAGIPHVAIVGNGKHDLALSEVTAPEVLADIVDVYTRPGVYHVGDGVTLCMLPWAPINRLVADSDGGDRAEIQAQAVEMMLAIARGLRDDAVGERKVLVLHGMVSGASVPTGITTDLIGGVVLPVEELAALGFDAILCGDIHRPQILHGGDDTSGPILYGGSLALVDFGEEHVEHGCWLVDVEPGFPTELSFISVPDRPFVTVDVDLTQDSSDERAASHPEEEGPRSPTPAGGGSDDQAPGMGARTPEPTYFDETDLIVRAFDLPLTDAVVRLRIRATEEQEQRIDLPAIRAFLDDAGVHKLMPVQRDIVRATRARVEGVTETLPPLEALDMWMRANDVAMTPLRFLTEAYLEKVRQGDQGGGGAMSPLRVRATNYRTFGDLDLELPLGVTAIVGDNGAGKSSIVNAVDVALFAARGELPALVTTGEESMEVTLDFEHNGQLHRARRTCRKGKASFDLERAWYEPDAVADTLAGWEPLSGASADATQETLERLLGLSRQTFRASSFLRQGDGDAFTGAKPSDRRDVLAQILGLAVWEQMLVLARADLRMAEDERVAIQASVELAQRAIEDKTLVQSELSAARESEAMTAAAVTAAEVDLEKATQAVAGVAAARERVKACEAEHAAARAAVATATEAVNESVKAADDRAAKQQELTDVAALADRIPEFEENVAELRALAAKATEALAKRGDLERQADQHRLEADRLDTDIADRRTRSAALAAKAAALRETDHDEEKCDRCEQHLGAEARVRAAASYAQEAADLGELATAHAARVAELRLLEQEARHAAAMVSVPEVVDVAPAERELASARAAAEKRSGLMPVLQRYAEVASLLRERKATLAAAVVDHGTKQIALDEARALVGDTAGLEQTVTDARERLAKERLYLTDLRAAIARGETMMETIVKAEQALADSAEARDKLAARITLLTLAVRAYNGTGVPALIVESTAIPQIEDEANRILRDLDTWYRVELRTQRQKKDGDLAESLDILIHDGTGERPYETYSGGERTRINLALQLSLARLLANRRGSESRFLVLDEPEFLDERGITRLVEVLQGLTDTFDRILLVTHHPAGAGSCDQQIHVVKHDDRSSLVAAEQMAVAA